MTTKHLFLALAATTFLSLSTATFAIDPADAGRTLPDICKSGGMGGMMGSGTNMGSMMGMMDQDHQDLAKGMDQMNANMMQGMTAKDIDVAFVCGMIPHHQGAIDMAKAELAHGKDVWAKTLAQSIIDAQEKEITDILAWLAKQPQQ